MCAKMFAYNKVRQYCMYNKIDSELFMNNKMLIRKKQNSTQYFINKYMTGY